MNCAKCGRANEDHFRFCLGCGANLEEQRAAARSAAPAEVWPTNCPTCSAPVQPGQRFCGACGSKVDPIAAAVSAPRVDVAPAAPVHQVATAAPTPAPVHSAPAPMAAGAAGQLVMINPDGSSGEAFPLVAGENIIGRSSPAQLFARDPYLSPKHVRFMVSPGSVHVTDLNSLNGVFYRITERTEIHDGEMLRVGHEVLRFSVLATTRPSVPTPADGTQVSGSPTGGAWGRLERISAPDEASYAFVLRAAEHVLGRERGDILFRDDGYVSGRHARIFSEGGRFFVEDLNSSNGTFVRIRGERVLGNGSLLLLGQQPFRIALA